MTSGHTDPVIVVQAREEGRYQLVERALSEISRLQADQARTQASPCAALLFPCGCGPQSRASLEGAKGLPDRSWRRIDSNVGLTASVYSLQRSNNGNHGLKLLYSYYTTRCHVTVLTVANLQESSMVTAQC
jgi:hypothetical protein